MNTTPPFYSQFVTCVLFSAALVVVDVVTSTLNAAPQSSPPVCYDLSRTFPREAGQYRVSRASRPVVPFEVMDGVYYVGNTQVGAHLIKTTEGLVLIDSTMPHQVVWLLESIRKLGFDPRDVKIVIGTHAHVDHVGGHGYFQQQFGTQTWLHEAEVPEALAGAWRPGQMVTLDGSVESLSMAFPPFKTDRVLRDGEVVAWGGRTFTFHRAPGHTEGTLFIEFPVRDPATGKPMIAGLLGGISGGATFRKTIGKLRGFDVRLWLGAHPDQNKTFEKQRRLENGAKSNPFIDPEGWQAFLERMAKRGGGS